VSSVGGRQRRVERVVHNAALAFCRERMLDLDRLDVFWTSDTGIDGENPVEIDELDLVVIDPLPSHVWLQDMADFSAGISDDSLGQQLARALQGRGAFRRFKTQIYERHPELISAWHALRDRRARRRAVDWLLDQGLIEEDTAQQFAADHQDPDLP
jgi:hypothetical protein